MLPIPRYPRGRWRLRLVLATALLSAGLVFGYGGFVTNRIIDVNTAQDSATNTAEANHFWRMVAGMEPTDRSDLGRVAAVARRKATGPHPFAAFKEYVGPGRLPDIGDRLGFHAFDRPDPNGRGGTVTDEGRFTDRFVLYSVQAAGALRDGSVDALIRPVPAVPSYGWLRWEWGAEALAALLCLSGLTGLWLRRDRRRWPARAERRAVAALSDEQRHIYRLVTSLEREPASEQRTELLAQAKELFEDMGRGLDTGDKLDELRAALDEAAATWKFTREAYDELPWKPTRDTRRG